MDDKYKALYEELCALISERAANTPASVESQIAVWEDRAPESLPLLLNVQIPQEYDLQFPTFNPGEIHNDKDKMLLYGMKHTFSALFADMQSVPSIRANMGCGIYPSLFPGILPLLFDDKMPWIKGHLSSDQVRSLREKDIVLTDEFKLALEHMAYIAEHIKDLGVYVYPLDLQGPFDVAHLVLGDQIFYGMYDEPELIHHLMDLSCYALELGWTENLKYIPDSDRLITHYNQLVMPRSRGGAKISEDTSTLLSAHHIDEFVTPYTQRILNHTGGGYIHYCGRNDHLFKCVLEMKNAYGINFGNPDMHDMDDILQQTTEAGKVYYGDCFRREDEDLLDYFHRCRKYATSKKDGKCRLLLTLNSTCDDQYDAIRAWQQAAGKVLLFYS